MSTTACASQEGVLGPLLAVLRFSDDGGAVRIADDIAFGLAARIWTQSVARAFAMSDRICAGIIWTNNYRMTTTTSPFGGFKMSGMGREGGIADPREYMKIKSARVFTGVEFPNPFVRR